jgi:gamma-glutamyltranspeptidase/glutathione hydrolase
LALQVLEPHMNGPAGDLVGLVLPAGAKTPRALCGQGVAPAGMTIAHFKALGLDVIPGTGHLPVVVPGSFGAWMMLLSDYGTMTVRDVMAPAIALARDGYPVIAGLARAINAVSPLFLEEWTTSAAVYCPGGRAPKEGERHSNPALAATYARIVAEAEQAGAGREVQIEAARRAFYEGFVAQAVERFARVPVIDSSGKRNQGVVTAADLAAWRASYEEPLSVDYHGWQVFKVGPWCQGPILLQALRILAHTDLGAHDVVGPEFVHLMVEAMKLAMADREAWYGDPKFADVPMGELLAPGYAAQRRKLIGERASLEIQPGAPGGRNPRLPHVPKASQHYQLGTGEPFRNEREMQELFDRREARRSAAEIAAAPAARGPHEGDTCHLDVTDRWGNVVAVTPSGAWLMSSPVVPELGFCLSLRGQMFWLEDGVPASLAPGKRPRTTLTPSMAFAPDGGILAWGTPGGDNQDQWNLQVFLRHVHGGLDLQAAIDAPMLQSDHVYNSFYPRQALPGRLLMESRFSEATRESLAKRGHGVEVTAPWSLGRNCAVARRNGWLQAAASPRHAQAYAAGR